MSKQDVWIAFLLKDKYSSENEKDKLKRQIIKKFKRNNNDVCYISCNQKNGLSYYFFVKEYLQEDLKNIYEFYSSYFSLYSYQAKITENELNEMLKTIDKKEENEIAKFGDFVMINKGKYKKLYGIVLRENRIGKVQVGLKFCFGQIIQTYDYKDLTSVGNIFNYIKVLK